MELIDPDTGLPVAPGLPGEVVVTSLSMPRGFLAVRYATGDIASWMDYNPCCCGRTSPRMGAIIGRMDQQLKIHGQTVFPDLIFDVLGGFDDISNELIIRCPDKLETQRIEVWISCSQNKATALCDRIRASLLQRLAVSPKLRVVPFELIQQIKTEKITNGNGVKVPRLVDLPLPIHAYLREQ